MSARPYQKPHKVINAVSMAASITSEVTIIDNKTIIGYDVSWSGSTPVGTMSVQVSNSYSLDPDGSVRDSGSWTTLTLSSSTAVSGNTGNGFIDIDITGAYAIRLVYTRVSGTGTMNAYVTSKVS